MRVVYALAFLSPPPCSPLCASLCAWRCCPPRLALKFLEKFLISAMSVGIERMNLARRPVGVDAADEVEEAV